MKEMLEGVFNSLQDLDMKPTPHNVRIMDDIYFTLREIYKGLEGSENGTENGPTADPGRQDQD